MVHDVWLAWASRGWRLPLRDARPASAAAPRRRAMFPSGPGEPSQPLVFNTVASPSMGVFRRVHPDGLFLPCGEGGCVEAGWIIASLQVDHLLLPVQSPGPGRIAAVLVAEGSLVGVGDPLFTIKP